MKLKSKTIKSKKKKKGFTLIELVAVLAIIAILSAAFVPKVGNYITEAKKVAVLNEAKKAQIPTTIKPLKILEPIILLKAISLFPVNAARILTDASGALVPIATIVKPMITLGTLRNLARLQLPSTNKSAPLIRKIKPIINKIYSMFSPFLRKSQQKRLLSHQKN